MTAYHRMIFTACTLVAKRYDALLVKGMEFSTLKNSILSTLAKSIEDDRKQNLKLDLLLEVYSEIKMNYTSNQEAIDNFIVWVSRISECVNSDYWNGEDVMGIFFNEFNRYKKKSEEDLLEHRTDGTDAFDTLYIGCEKFPQHDIYPVGAGGVM